MSGWLQRSFLLTAGVGILVLAQPGMRGPAQPADVDSKVLRTAGSTKDGSWLTYGLTQSETRYSLLDQINAQNVSRLGLSWTYAAGAGGGNQEATPLVLGDTIYGITTWSVVFALDAHTGKERWRWDPEVNQET